MQSNTLSVPARTAIEQYLSLPSLEVPAPYYNNRRHKLVAGLRALAGKGLPEEIVEEAELFSIREKVNLASISWTDKTKFLVDHHLGIDCSGFVYHVLDAESRARGAGAMHSHISFHHRSFLRRLVARLRPAQNAGAITFAQPTNSREVDLAEAEAGDFIVMTHNSDARSFDHIILITHVDKATTHTTLTYTHSIAWPSDGMYGHGVRTGTITVTDPLIKLADQVWEEHGKAGVENYTHGRAVKAETTSLRRLNWF
ncbi:MAG: hypothetical protein AAB391_03805 [Patescibacteria group bacterium]